ncbi:MAG TPA: hydrogenase formation protein HypD [Vicinamibacterales bacterium]|nr:hydrogenase formation protein HypD [Vicinamibacterales bacterium]
MKYVDEYRDARLARALAADIGRRTTRDWVMMEICGGQTHTIMRYGVDELLPPAVELVHGPGCPVCVTPIETIDKAVEIASQPDVTFVSYGDMLRVPGSRSDLFHVKAAGGDVRVVYSPMDALKIARQRPERRVVFFAVGFETTAPANAMAVWQAHREGLANFSMLVSHVLVPPAIRLLLGSPANRVQAFIAPGHVCTVMGYSEYEELVREYHVPIVVGGFEPVDILEAIRMIVAQLEEGRAEIENQYVRSVSYDGNEPAQRIMAQVFEVCDKKWRGVGPIPQSGYRLRPELAAHDADRLFGLSTMTAEEPPECISAQVLQGLKKPTDCAAFGTRCTPERPLGAPMVSTEGACAAYHQYRRHAMDPVKVRG